MVHIEHVGPAEVPDEARPCTVRMRDGVRLSTDVYLSGSGEPGPVVLIRLPYDKTGTYTFVPQVAGYFTARGYHVVAQDVRGKFRSEGESLVFVNEAADGHDTIDWVTRQPFSDGVVGMWGDSYYGYTQLAAASTAHPALRAISPRVTGTRLGELPVDVPGEPTRPVEMFVSRLYPCTYFHARDIYMWEPDWTRRPYAASVEEFFAQVGSRSASWDQWFPHPVLLRRFPFGHPFDAPAIPVLLTIGWWDNCAPWQWSDHEEIQRRGAWSLLEHLVVEPIDHENNYLPDDDGHAPEATLSDMLDPTVEFFDVHLRGLAPASSIPRVRWTLARTGEVRVAETWPPAGVVPVDLHLTAGGRLAAEPEATAGELTWVHDPDSLVPSPTANAFDFLNPMPDERAWSSRGDVLVFDGPATEADDDLVGGVTLTLTVASSGPRMDVFARLLDVRPDGAAHLVARGQLHLVDASAPQQVEVDLGQLGYRLRRGHRLRLHLASSDFPEYVPQPGTGEHPWLAVDVARNTQRLSLGDAQARLRLHRLPPG